jgi:hypothetical protein
VTSTSPSSHSKHSTFTLHVLGSSFVGGATVTISGDGVTYNSTIFVSSAEIDVNITLSSNASQTSRDVTVTNPDQGVGTGSGVFTVTS